MTGVKKCSQCGKMVSGDGTFCPFCGNIIDEIIMDKGYTEHIDIQSKYRNDINNELQKQRKLERTKRNLEKRKQSLELKIDNYDKILKNKIPFCKRNETVPDISIIKKEAFQVDSRWYVALVIALLEIISGLIPWITIFDDYFSRSISCTSIFNLLNEMSSYGERSETVLNTIIFIIILGYLMIFLNGYFIVCVLQKKIKDIKAIGTIAGSSGILVSLAIFLYKWYLETSIEEAGMKWSFINTQIGVWLMLGAGVALILYCQYNVEIVNAKESVLRLEVTNYDPVLPIRIKTLEIERKNEEWVLELTYVEFEWTLIEEIIVDVQLVKYDGSVKTLCKNAVFEKKGQNFARFHLKNAGYNLEGTVSARVNILTYNMYKNQKRYQEKGSGFSAYSDYSVDELSSIRSANFNIVMCREKTVGEYHQCSCGQMYSNKISICPLCGKTRKA